MSKGRDINVARGEAFSSWMQVHDTTVDKVAEAAGVDPVTVRNWMAGLSEPRASQAFKLENLVGRGLFRKLGLAS